MTVPLDKNVTGKRAIAALAWSVDARTRRSEMEIVLDLGVCVCVCACVYIQGRGGVHHHHQPHSSRIKKYYNIMRESFLPFPSSYFLSVISFLSFSNGMSLTWYFR